METHSKEEKEIQLCDNFVQTYIKRMEYVYLHSRLAKQYQAIATTKHNNIIELMLCFCAAKERKKN